MNSRSLSGGALAMLVAVLIVSTEADTKYCFCDLRYSTTRLVSGQKIDSFPLLADLPDPYYKHWLAVLCNRVNKHCPNDCLHKAAEWLGSVATPSSHFTRITGPTACTLVRQNAPPSNRIYVYASYDPSSVCGDRTYQFITELCCWEKIIPKADPIYLYNHMCEQSRSPLD